ncbi:hypothetical protein FHS27_000369 [Rhodopirellula rubra]|uniref:Uncharacterized protein n=1 Tax=Aporhodopirellula rubra TaxID=980271 RepID=A0A7W5DUJ1_9BACT|nr:hypothetical protein [Aporhodopirellula rubra]MBB3204605.1 hypothetical protein [Aporhodopirellula rubra]
MSTTFSSPTSHEATTWQPSTKISSLGAWKHPLETIWHLESVRTSYRLHRFWARIRSPRQAAASFLAIGFILLYLLAGFTVLSRRDVVDPGRLQLWLSGGMVLYTLYHSIKYLWASRPVDAPTCVVTTPAMSLWVGGGPMSRMFVVLHDVARVVPATIMKSLLLCVVLWRDVPNLFSLWMGVFLALFTLEWMRRIVSHVIDAMNRREKKFLQTASLVVAFALVAALGLQTINETPPGGDPAMYMSTAISEVALFAGSDTVQWFALPLQPASHLAVSQPMWPFTQFIPAAWMPLHCLALLLSSIATIALLGVSLIRLDDWSIQRRHASEQALLRSWNELSPTGIAPGNTSHDASAVSTTSATQNNGSSLNKTSSFNSSTNNRAARTREIESYRPLFTWPLWGIVARQLHCIRRYRANVLVSFAIPMAVSLSPLLMPSEGLAGQAAKQWIFVIGGIALSSLLLAPPALQIDFRRDLKRIGLLRSFPLTASEMCAGMLSVPVAITILFQWITLAVASLIADVPAAQVGWLAVAFPSLAVLTFAIENSLFLAFPHQIHDQGIAMVIRAKITFLWKGLVLAFVPFVLFLWVTACHSLLPENIVFPVAFTGSLIGCWTCALAAFGILVGCWKRFDPAIDTPPD